MNSVLKQATSWTKLRSIFCLNDQMHFKKSVLHALEGRHLTNDRFEKIWPLVLVVHEHAAAVRLLVSQNLGNSALALMRVLFEAVVRQMWVGMCASPTELDILYADLSMEALDDSAGLPMASARPGEGGADLLPRLPYQSKVREVRQFYGE